MELNAVLTVTFTLFAVIDMIGAVPLIISLKERIPGIHALKVTVASAVLMFSFLLAGEPALRYLGVDLQSFAIAGSIVMFILAMEMVLGIHVFKHDPDISTGNIVPVAFPIIAGSGTLTTIMSLKSTFSQPVIAVGILINLLVIFAVVGSTRFIHKILGPTGLAVMRKFFGIILLSISVRIFRSNLF